MAHTVSRSLPADLSKMIVPEIDFEQEGPVVGKVRGLLCIHIVTLARHHQKSSQPKELGKYTMPSYDVVIIGAGAAGMMCAIEAGKRGRKVLLIDHAKKAGEKIRISGGGRCNFTNSDCKAGNFISGNPHFIKSALSQYSAADFITLVDRYKISWHEKVLGQLFCDNRSTDIVNMLQNEMDLATVELRLQVEVETITKDEDEFIIDTKEDSFRAKSLVIATGGKSIPKMGATGFGYSIAKQFDLAVTQTRPALVPLTFDPERLKALVLMAGLGFDCEVSVGKTRFREAALFTHRGLSGPAILQISSYWREGDEIQVDFHHRT